MNKKLFIFIIKVVCFLSFLIYVNFFVILTMMIIKSQWASFLEYIEFKTGFAKKPLDSLYSYYILLLVFFLKKV
jgi:hypothetical protein